jgi:hypothetical protein
MSHDAETAWIGRANEVRRVLKKNGADLTASEKAGVTKVQVSFANHVVDSQANTNTVTYSAGVVSIRFGRISGIKPGTYNVRLVVFDATAGEGYNWGEFILHVMS